MVDMSPSEIDALMNQARIGRLCMAGPEGRPYAIPLPFCWNGGTVYVRLPLTGRKGQILSGNQRVCFEVDAISDNLDEYASVLVEGKLVPVLDTHEKLRVKAANHHKYERLRNGYRPGHGRTTPLADLPMRKIVIENVSGRKKTPADALATTPQSVAAAQ